MLLSKDAIADVVEILRERDFYRPAHELIYDAIIDLYGRGEPADAVTVSAELTKRGDIARAGGAPYLHTLISSVPTAANAGYYAKIIREHAILRRLVEAGTKIVQLGYAVEGEVDDAVDQAQAEVYAVTERRSSEDYVQLSTLLPQALDEIENISKGIGVEGVMTGFKALDELTHGLHPGNMIILAARPAVGKSTLGLDIARHASIHDGKTSVIFSLEMSRSEITMRMLSAEARVGLNNIRSGQLSDEEWTRLARRMGEISDAPLFIDDSPNLSMMEIRAKASSGKRVENRQQEVSEFSRHLKLMAKELDVPVIAISQLNRSPEQRSDKKPMLSDLRESGSIEQDADVVILLHRDDMYDSQNRSGEADLIVAKHRNGPTRTITVAAQLHFARFFDMAQNPGSGTDFTQQRQSEE
jgi:replicative DNA helicase